MYYIVENGKKISLDIPLTYLLIICRNMCECVQLLTEKISHNHIKHNQNRILEYVSVCYT